MTDLHLAIKNIHVSDRIREDWDGTRWQRAGRYAVGWRGDMAVIIGGGAAEVSMPWWAILILVLASIALTAYKQRCRYRLGERALDKASSRNVDKVARAIMPTFDDSRWRWGERLRRPPAQDPGAESSAAESDT